MNRSSAHTPHHSGLAFLLLLTGLFLSSCLPANIPVTGIPEINTSSPSPPLLTEIGEASYYHDRFEGRTTANGEIFSQNGMTAAHRTFPFGTVVRIIHLINSRSVTVRINDRGPYAEGRIIDMSRRAAEELGMIRAGTAEIRLEVLQWGN